MHTYCCYEYQPCEWIVEEFVFKRRGKKTSEGVAVKRPLETAREQPSVDRVHGRVTRLCLKPGFTTHPVQFAMASSTECHNFNIASVSRQGILLLASASMTHVKQ